jgi:uncharacterized protein (DUF849 family)
MTQNVIITCAVTGASPTAHRNPHVPVTPVQIAAAAVAAGKEGAAVVHIHVRDPQTGLEAWRPELFREVVSRIREQAAHLIVNLTTGFGAAILLPQSSGEPDVSGFLEDQMERFAHVQELLPEICSLDCGTINFGERELFVNSPDWLARGAQLLQRIGVKPELEVFDLGHIRYASELIDRGFIERRALFQLCMGIAWGAPATCEAMLAMRNALPRDVVWSGFGIGKAQLSCAIQAALLGGHVRVGLEDNLYLKRGIPASNPALVANLVEVLARMDIQPMAAAAARATLGLRSRSDVPDRLHS